MNAAKKKTTTVMLPSSSWYRLQARLHPTIDTKMNYNTHDDPARGDGHKPKSPRIEFQFPHILRQALFHLNIVSWYSYLSFLLPHAPIVAPTLPACCTRVSRQELDTASRTTRPASTAQLHSMLSPHGGDDESQRSDSSSKKKEKKNLTSTHRNTLKNSSLGPSSPKVLVLIIASRSTLHTAK